MVRRPDIPTPLCSDAPIFRQKSALYCTACDSTAQYCSACDSTAQHYTRHRSTLHSTRQYCLTLSCTAHHYTTVASSALHNTAKHWSTVGRQLYDGSALGSNIQHTTSQRSTVGLHRIITMRYSSAQHCDTLHIIALCRAV